MSASCFVEAFLDLEGIRIYIDGYIVHDDQNYRFAMKDEEIPLCYDKNKKVLVYRFHPYIMPYGTFVKLVDFMYEQGYLPFRMSSVYFNEKDMANAVANDGDVAIEICQLDCLNRPNPNAYIIFNSVAKTPIVSANIPAVISFADMVGVL